MDFNGAIRQLPPLCLFLHRRPPKGHHRAQASSLLRQVHGSSTASLARSRLREENFWKPANETVPPKRALHFHLLLGFFVGPLTHDMGFKGCLSGWGGSFRPILDWAEIPSSVFLQTFSGLISSNCGNWWALTSPRPEAPLWPLSCLETWIRPCFVLVDRLFALSCSKFSFWCKFSYPSPWFKKGVVSGATFGVSAVLGCKRGLRNVDLINDVCRACFCLKILRVLLGYGWATAMPRVQPVSIGETLLFTLFFHSFPCWAIRVVMPQHSTSEAYVW